MRWYDWKDVVKVAHENEQKCADVIKAICTHLSSLEIPFPNDWKHVDDPHITFHEENVVKVEATNMTIYSSKKRHLVGLRIKDSQSKHTMTFEVTVFSRENLKVIF